MKRWILASILGIFPCMTLYAENVPEELSLVFPDRTLTLNFSAQPELLQIVPSHFWNAKGTLLPIDFNGILPERTEFLDIKTFFHKAISPSALQKFFEFIGGIQFISLSYKFILILRYTVINRKYNSKKHNYIF